MALFSVYINNTYIGICMNSQPITDSEDTVRAVALRKCAPVECAYMHPRARLEETILDIITFY